MGRKVTIEIKPNGRQANACCSVLYQVPCIWCSMLHKQVRRRVHYTCRHCDLLPKRSELHANDVYTQQIFEKGRHSYYVANRLLGRLLHIYYQNKYQLLSRVGSNRQHLLSQAFPFDYSLCLLLNTMKCGLYLHLLLLHKQSLQREDVLNCRNCHLYSRYNAYRCCINLIQLYVYELSCTQTLNCHIQLSAQLPLSKNVSNILCNAQISRVHNLANFLLELKHHDSKMPICYSRSNTKLLSRLFHKRGKYHQSCFCKNHQTLFLMVLEKVTLMAYHHKLDSRQQRSRFAKILVVCQQPFSNYVSLMPYRSVQSHLPLGISNNFFADNNLKIQQRLVFQSFRNPFLFVIFSFSYNPCIILIINRVENKLTYGFEASDFAEVPLTQNRQNLLREEWNSATVNPLGISPVNRTLSNILELGCVGLSWNITLSTAPTKFRSLHLASPMLRQEADGGIGLLFLLNVRQNKNAPAIRTGMGLQGHIYVVPKPSYLFNAIATLTLNQKALQKYNEFLNHARNVNFVLTFRKWQNLRKIAAKKNITINNSLNFRTLKEYTKWNTCQWNIIGDFYCLPP